MINSFFKTFISYRTGIDKTMQRDSCCWPKSSIIVVIIHFLSISSIFIWMTNLILFNNSRNRFRTIIGVCLYGLVRAVGDLGPFYFYYYSCCDFFFQFFPFDTYDGGVSLYHGYKMTKFLFRSSFYNFFPFLQNLQMWTKISFS